MRKTKPIAVSLDPESLRVLDGAAVKWGTRSEAVRKLLAEYRERKELLEMEAQYRAYYSDPRLVREGLELTRDMRHLVSWPPEWKR